MTRAITVPFLFASLFVFGVALSLLFSTAQNSRAFSEEVGVAELSPEGVVGGYAIPASACSLTRNPIVLGQGLTETLTWSPPAGGNAEIRRGGVVIAASVPKPYADPASSGLAIGNYIYQADPAGSYTACAGTVYVRVNGVDLFPATPTCSSGCGGIAGTNRTFRSVISNQGSENAGPFATSFEIDLGRDGTIDTTILGTPFASFNNVNDSGVNTTANSNSVGWTSVYGSHRVRAVADSNGTVAEANEANNVSPWFNFTVFGSTQCNNGIDDADPEDTLIDQADPGCHTDLDVSNPVSYDPNDASETNGAVPPTNVVLSVRKTGGAWGTGNIVVNPGDQLELKWSSTGATSCGGSNFSTGAGSPTSGTQTNITEPTTEGETITYTLVCTNNNGTPAVPGDDTWTQDSISATYSVVVVTGPITLSFSPTKVRKGTSATVTWDTGGRPGCSLTGTNGDSISISSSSGSASTAAIMEKTTYTMRCSFDGSFLSAVVNVLPIYREL